MFPFLALVAVAAVAIALGRKDAKQAQRTIPGPAGANVEALPPGSIVMTHDVDEAIVIVSQGPLGYFGHTMISARQVTFTPDEITMVQFVAPTVPGTILPT